MMQSWRDLREFTMPFRNDLRQSTWAKRLTDILRTVFSQASEAGVGRKTIAMRMGRSAECIGTWLEPSMRVCIPGGALLELLSRDDLLPQHERDALWTKLGLEGGYTVVRDDAAETDDAPPVQQLAEISVAVGRLSSTVLESMRSKSAGGSHITADEAVAILDEAMTVSGELHALIEAVKKAKGGKK